MKYNTSKFTFDDNELKINLAELGRELGVTTEELSEILPKYSESYKSSIWNMEKYIESRKEVIFEKINEKIRCFLGKRKIYV